MSARRLHRLRGWARVAALSAAAVLLVGLPLWLVIVSSVKSQAEVAQLSLDLPAASQAFENYSTVIDQSDYPRSLVNSVLVTGIAVAILLAFGSLAAWAFARARSRTMRLLYALSLVGVLLPAAVVPTVFLLRLVGLQGTQGALVLFTLAARMSLVVFLLTGFARALPRELEESAAVDGATRLRTFRSIVLPLMSPVIVSTFVILVVLIWNDFFGPLFLLAGKDRATLPLGLYQLSSGFPQATAWHLVFAHVVLVSLPLIAVYVVAQRRIVGGLTAGAVRG